MKITHKQFQGQIEDLFKLYNYRFYHTYRSTFSVAGFPDYLALRGNKQVVAELKVGKDKPTAEQEEWLHAFSELDNCEVHVWRPEDTLEAIAEILK